MLKTAMQLFLSHLRMDRPFANVWTIATKIILHLVLSMCLFMCEEFYDKNVNVRFYENKKAQCHAVKNYLSANISATYSLCDLKTRG